MLGRGRINYVTAARGGTMTWSGLSQKSASVGIPKESGDSSFCSLKTKQYGETGRNRRLLEYTQKQKITMMLL